MAERGGVWWEIADMFDDEVQFTGATHSIGDAILLAPVLPLVIVGVSHNLFNSDHVLPIQAFLKSPRTLANPGDEVPVRTDIGPINMEVELAIVIGKPARNLTVDNAFDVVFGYTIVNDVTNAGQVGIDEKFTQVKNGDRYTPLGPWIETEFPNPNDRRMSMSVNGTTRLTSSTSLLQSGLAEILAYVTEWVELDAGDVVLTGAPNTSLLVSPGDVVDCSVEGLGTLQNRVIHTFV